VDEIVHANMAARELLDAKTVLRSAQGQLMASDPQANQSLRAIFTFADGGDDALGIKGIDLPLPAQHGAPYVAHVLPLTSGERRRAGAAYTAVAAIFVRKAALQTPSQPGAIGALYRLTPAELRVLLAVSMSAACPRWPRHSGWRTPPSKPISAACSRRPA
jgi:hypothetical protein